jgi:hypothetical protein
MAGRWRVSKTLPYIAGARSSGPKSGVANDLAAVEPKPLLLQVEFKGIRKRLTMPLALPGEDFQLEDEQ